MGLELALPAALWGLAVGVPVILAHLYFKRRRRIEVPFVGLLRETIGTTRTVARFRKLREAAALCARLLALTCAVLALGGLRPAQADKPPVDLMIVIDADVTTSAVEADGRIRLAHGLELAAAHVRAHMDGRVGAILASDAPFVVSSLSKDREHVAEKIDALRAEVERGEALPAATRVDLYGAQGQACGAVDLDRDRVHLITARAHFDTHPDDDEFPTNAPLHDVRVFGAGRARDDQGIVGFSVTSQQEGASYRVTLRVRNSLDRATVRRLVGVVGNAVIFDEMLSIEASGAVDASFDTEAPKAGEWLRLTLGGSDAFPVNDQVSAWLVPPLHPSVLLVRGRNARRHTVAALQTLGVLKDIDAAGSTVVDPGELARADMRDVVVVDGVTVPAGSLRPGAYLFLAPLAGDLPFDVGAPIEKPLVWRMERDHPLVRQLDFTTPYVESATPVKGEGLRPLAYAEGQPVVAEGERDGIRYVVLGLDYGDSQLLMDANVPILIRQAIRRLAYAPKAPLAPFYVTGDVLRPQTALPGGPTARVAWKNGGAGDAVVTRVDPEGEGWTLPAGAHGEAVITTGSDEQPTWQGRTGFVDLDPERDITPARAQAVAPDPARETTPKSEVWRRWLIAGAVLFLLLDLLLVRRRKDRTALRTA